jgi:hypothetical protein
MDDERVTDPRAFAVSLWNRWFRSFNKHIQRCGYGPDLNQTIEEISLACKGLNRTEFSKVGQKEFREFMKSIGFRKREGYWVLREFQFNQEAWDKFYKTGLFNPKGR